MAETDAMRMITTGVFSLLFAVVVGFYIYLQPLPPSSQDTGPQASMRLVSLKEGDEIQKIQIQNSDKNEIITLALEDKAWNLKEPVSYPADPFLVKGLVSALTLSSKIRQLKPEKDWDEYGLARPSMKIGVQTKLNRSFRYLFFGNISPVANHIFARWEGESEYFLLDPDLKNAFDKSVYSLRWKAVFRRPFTELSKIAVETKDKKFEISRRGDVWYWVEPIDILGDTVTGDHMNEILNQLMRLSIKEFLDGDPRQASDLGFSDPTGTIALWGPDDQLEYVCLGSEFPMRDSFYAHRKGEDIFFLVDRNNVRTFFEIVEVSAEEVIKSASQPEGQP
ncbi:MAG: DUF4340 domain-containing protein [Candidatus Omnitrophica bacterium]|nr:DUF4340 domain-containing protein [Candidatus Omnitrophota bacterium]